MNDLYADVLMQISDKSPLQNTFTGEDGLEYCRKCETPVQCRLQLGEITRVVRCLCRCEIGQRQQKEDRRREQERQIAIQRLRAAGIQETHLRNLTFSVARETPHLQVAKSYVNNWTQAKAENLGLLLWGDIGTGKSFLAACIANALIDQQVPVLMTNFSKILNQMGEIYAEDRYSYIASFSRFPLLIIDDLGIERNTGYALEQVYAVIDERYKSGLPLIVTTNLTIFQMQNPRDAAHARIYSRVLEMCTPVQITGGDLRMDTRKTKQALAKEVLFQG